MPEDVANDVADIIKKHRSVKKVRINLRDSLTYSVEDSKQDPKLYRRWRNMHQRVRGSHPMAKYYLGVRICRSWYTYAKFALWCYTQPNYHPDKELDRIDCHGDYKPSNCRFVSRIENARNLKRNLYVEWEGSEYLLCDLCERLELNYNTVYHRYYRYGWSIEDAILLPPYATPSHKRKS